MITLAAVRPLELGRREIVVVPRPEIESAQSLKAALEHEIAHHCRNRVTKRLVLKLALAVVSQANGGMFYAERLATRLQVRLRHEAALKEIYLERFGE